MTLKWRLVVGLLFAGLCVLALYGLVVQLLGRGRNAAAVGRRVATPPPV